MSENIEARYYLTYTTPDGEQHRVRVVTFAHQRIESYGGVRKGYGWGKKQRLMAMQPGERITIPVIGDGDRSGWASLASKIKRDSTPPGKSEPERLFHVSRPSHDNKITIICER